ncbi:hypothetical protein Tco_0887630 [Tanacetum coccineum]
MGHDDEIVLTRVRISTLKILIKDIQLLFRIQPRDVSCDSVIPRCFMIRIYVCHGCLSYILYCDDSYLYVSGITMVLLPPGFLEPLYPVGSSSPVRSTTPPPDFPFDESIFVELDNLLWIIPRPLGSEPVPEKPNKMAPKRTSTSAAPAMTQAAIRKLVADSVAAALEAQAANMANIDNTNRNS